MHADCHHKSTFLINLALNATALVVWLTALFKLLGHTVKLGGGLAINVVSFPAIKNIFQREYCVAALGFSWPVYGVSGFWTMRPRESQKWGGGEYRQKYRRTNGESRSVWPQKQTPKKETTLWSNERRLAHCITSVQYHKQCVTLDCSKEWDRNS